MFRNPAQLASTRAPCAARTSGSSRASCRTSRTCTRTSGSWCVRARAGTPSLAAVLLGASCARAWCVCVCLARSRAARSLGAHARACAQPKPAGHDCTMCGKNFQTEWKLRVHLAFVHADLGIVVRARGGGGGGGVTVAAHILRAGRVLAADAHGARVHVLRAQTLHGRGEAQAPCGAEAPLGGRAGARGGAARAAAPPPPL